MATFQIMVKADHGSGGSQKKRPLEKDEDPAGMSKK